MVTKNAKNAKTTKAAKTTKTAKVSKTQEGVLPAKVGVGDSDFFDAVETIVWYLNEHDDIFSDDILSIAPDGMVTMMNYGSEWQLDTLREEFPVDVNHIRLQRAIEEYSDCYDEGEKNDQLYVIQKLLMNVKLKPLSQKVLM